MTPQREDVLAKVRKWVGVADDDLAVARHILELRPHCPFRMAAYHAQQCAEKYLKGYLVWRDIDFPHTHNIARLRKLCSEHADWVAELHDADELSPFAITARYPGESLVVTQADADLSVQIAERVRRAVRQALENEGLEL